MGKKVEESRVVGAIKWLTGLDLPTMEELLWGSKEPELILGPGVDSDLEFSDEELEMLDDNGFDPRNERTE